MLSSIDVVRRNRGNERSDESILCLVEKNFDRYARKDGRFSMKILWLSNTVLSDSDSGTSGTWLGALLKGLVESGSIELANIAMGTVATLTKQDCGPVRQWVIPAVQKLGQNGLPPEQQIDDIISAVREFGPDLVHVWGTECFWGLLTARNFIHQVALLEMQGLKFTIVPVFAGGLSVKEQMKCTGIKELVRSSSIWQGRKRFEMWAAFEKEIISGHKNIGVQSKWVDAQVQSINSHCMTFHCDLLLRKLFYSATKWNYTGNEQIFCSAAYPAPFKGLHVAIRALALLRNKIPNVTLRIAGGLSAKGIRQDGYISWLKREIKKFGLESNVVWLGALDATRIISELHSSAVALIPSYVESYCMALAEAMMLGVPSVTTYTGGTTFLAKDEDTALFYSPGDEAMCAYQLERVLTDRALGARLSSAARESAVKRHDPEKITSHYLHLYRQIISDAQRGSR
jgi:glycosyltransferase involved in cell wall biosynthesis